jgi:hypothetical protein
VQIDRNTQLGDLKQFSANLAGHEKLHAKYDKKTDSYTLYEAKGGGTGLKNFLFGTNAKREANVQQALRMVINNHSRTEGFSGNAKAFGAFDHAFKGMLSNPDIKKGDINNLVWHAHNAATEPPEDERFIVRLPKSPPKISSTPLPTTTEEKDQDTTVHTPNQRFTAKFLDLLNEIEDFNAQCEKEKGPSTDKPSQRFSVKHDDLMKEIESLGSKGEDAKTGGTLSNKRLTTEISRLLDEIEASEPMDISSTPKPTQTEAQRSSRRFSVLMTELLQEIEAEEKKAKV